MITGSAASSPLSFLPFYFRLHAPSIQQAQLSRSLGQAKGTGKTYQKRRTTTKTLKPYLLVFLCELMFSRFLVNNLSYTYNLEKNKCKKPLKNRQMSERTWSIKACTSTSPSWLLIGIHRMLCVL